MKVVVIAIIAAVVLCVAAFVFIRICRTQVSEAAMYFLKEVDDE